MLAEFNTVKTSCGQLFRALLWTQWYLPITASIKSQAMYWWIQGSTPRFLFSSFSVILDGLGSCVVNFCIYISPYALVGNLLRVEPPTRVRFSHDDYCFKIRLANPGHVKSNSTGEKKKKKKDMRSLIVLLINNNWCVADKNPHCSESIDARPMGSKKKKKGQPRTARKRLVSGTCPGRGCPCKRTSACAQRTKHTRPD